MVCSALGNGIYDDFILANYNHPLKMKTHGINLNIEGKAFPFMVVDKVVNPGGRWSGDVMQKKGEVHREYLRQVEKNSEVFLGKGGIISHIKEATYNGKPLERALVWKARGGYYTWDTGIDDTLSTRYKDFVKQCGWIDKKDCEPYLLSFENGIKMRTKAGRLYPQEFAKAMNSTDKVSYFVLPDDGDASKCTILYAVPAFKYNDSYILLDPLTAQYQNTFSWVPVDGKAGNLSIIFHGLDKKVKSVNTAPEYVEYVYEDGDVLHYSRNDWGWSALTGGKLHMKDATLEVIPDGDNKYIYKYTFTSGPFKGFSFEPGDAKYSIDSNSSDLSNDAYAYLALRHEVGKWSAIQKIYQTSTGLAAGLTDDGKLKVLKGAKKIGYTPTEKRKTTGDIERERLLAPFYSKYGKKYVDAAVNGQIIVGMPFGLIETAFGAFRVKSNRPGLTCWQVSPCLLDVNTYMDKVQRTSNYTGEVRILVGNGKVRSVTKVSR